MDTMYIGGGEVPWVCILIITYFYFYAIFSLSLKKMYTSARLPPAISNLTRDADIVIPRIQYLIQINLNL